jgi:hypothetical protein
MAFNEALRKRLNRWLHRNSNRLIEEARERASDWGRHAIIQDIALDGDILELGQSYCVTVAECRNTDFGSHLRNLILNYSTERQAVVIFNDVHSRANMTVVLTYDEGKASPAQRA